MFITPLFTIASTWKQSRCSLTNEWIKKDVVHTYNNLRYAGDVIRMAESKEGLKSLLIKVKEESEKMA